jgi:hypothetical protein
MPFNDKIRLISNGCELIGWETDIDVDDAMTLRAGEVMVVLASITDTIVVCPIRKLDPGKQTHIHQLFDRTIDGGSAYTWLGLS